MSEQLRGLRRIKEAWIVRKRVIHFPDDPVYVILFRPTLFASTKKLTAWMVQDLECPGLTFFLPKKGLKRRFVRSVEQIGRRLI